MIPDFLVIGAMKAATTSLHDYLRTHPDVYMPAQKEIDFFSQDDLWARGGDWYRHLFAAAPPGAVVGEASPSYTRYPEHPRAAERIAAFAPAVKLVYCVRDPVERLVSHHQHEVARGREHRPLDEAVAADPRYLDTSRYGLQLAQHLEHVEPDQVLVVDSEHLRADRVAVMSRLFEFLGVDPAWRGYESAPELYGTADRLTATGLVAFLGENRLLRPVRRRLSPRVKRQIRSFASTLVPGRQRRQVVPDDQLEPTLRAALEEALEDDQRLFRELRARCHG